MAEKGSDLFYDVCCDICEEKNVNKQAMFYCQKCSKGLCDDCLGLHKQFFTKHVAYGREEMDKWPSTTKSFDDMQFCLHHPDRLIEMYCEDHGKLCCSMCHFHEHRPCIKLVLIKDKSQAFHDAGEFHKICATITNVQQELKTAIDDTQEFLKKLQGSYDKAYDEIKVFRQKINDILDELERSTIYSLETLLQTMKQSLKTDTDKCSKATNGLKKISDAITNIKTDQNDLSFIAYQRASEMVSHADNILKELTVHRSTVVTFKSNPSIDETLSGFRCLGDIKCAEKQLENNKNTILKCSNKSLYDIRSASDNVTCEIRGIWELPGGEILIADNNNKRVKLLDTQYKVVTHTDCWSHPWDMCSISPTEVAVTVGVYARINTVQFLIVNNRQIVKGRELKIIHNCHGIAHFNGSLFITSLTALYQYTLAGQLVKKIYEDTSGNFT
ncbi:hypothetical protein DPMN_105533, partial [Dreissena polymorpha]